ncbi:MAG: DUF1499 domain-containing protein [Rhodobacter sp.]|nr:DUF1499 domain-containing protein [Rhodobacter sp.]
MKLVLILAVLGLAGLAYIRLAPSDPVRWHIDPRTAADPGQRGVLVRHDVPLPPSAALARFDGIVRSTPRTRVLAGTPEDGQITYVVRSKWLGFPDYVTVRAVETDGAAALVILSRLRFGLSDLGVNRARLDGWLDALDAVQQ